MTVTKDYLKQAVDVAKSETTTALQIVFDALNKGQQQKLLKNEDVLLIFERYNVNIE
jgi:hypothetical protein